MTMPTPGPWRWELNCKSKQVQLMGGIPAFDLLVMDFVRWGTQRAKPRFRDDARCLMKPCEEFGVIYPGREHHADWFQLLNHPDARLIETAPDLLNACEKALEVFEGKRFESGVPALLRKVIEQAKRREDASHAPAIDATSEATRIRVEPVPAEFGPTGGEAPSGPEAASGGSDLPS